MKFSNLVQLLPTEIGVLERLLTGDEAIPEAIVQPPVVLTVNISLRGEIPNLAGEPSRKLGGVEAIDRTNAALSGEQLLVAPRVLPERLAAGVDVAVELAQSSPSLSPL